MSNEALQSYENHVRRLPPLLVAVGVVFAANVLWTIAVAWQYPRILTFVPVVVASALLVLLWPVRTMVLTVQDRVIRLEERLRLERLLPAELEARIPELTVSQLVALRFASDAEVADLTRQVLDERLSDRKAIKRRIKSWRPDHQRA